MLTIAIKLLRQKQKTGDIQIPNLPNSPTNQYTYIINGDRVIRVETKQINALFGWRKKLEREKSVRNNVDRKKVVKK